MYESSYKLTCSDTVVRLRLIITAIVPQLLLVATGVEQHRYCIIGAGPAGIQLGHFLKHAGRDYVIFEKNARAGSFFEKYPRHRKLISLNKRKVREGRGTDFAFRHDWNTLIDVRAEENRTRPMTERSKELFPHAGILAGYLQEFAYEQQSHIHYETNVEHVARASDGGFEVKLSGVSQLHALCQCQEVILAHGLTRPVGAAVKVDGARHLIGYEELPETGESFEGKAVVILGQGNAAMETAQELQKYTSEVHVYSRPRKLPEGGEGVRFAYQTHYVGDIRAGRTTILDTYLLKSLDTFDFDALGYDGRLVIIPCQGRLCTWTVGSDQCLGSDCKQNHYKAGQNLNYMLEIARFPVGSEILAQLKASLATYAENAAGAWEFQKKRIVFDGEVEEHPDPQEEANKSNFTELHIDPAVFENTYEELSVTANLLRRFPELMDELADIRARYSDDNQRYPMDHVIRCFGWVMDTRFLDPSLAVQMTQKNKYPNISHAFAVTGVPGMYAAGTISHSLDFRKSAGGFIHGFRYTARALFRLLEEKNFGVPWPQTFLELDLNTTASGSDSLCPSSEQISSCSRVPDQPNFTLDGLVDRLFERINDASGPYQMFESLGDMLLFDSEEVNGTRRWGVRYLEEVPLAEFHSRYRAKPRLTWVFRYNENFHGPKVIGPDRVGTSEPQSAHRSNFLHPHIAFYPAGQEEPEMRHWLKEDIFTQWGSPDERVPLTKFLHLVSHAAWQNDKFTSNQPF